MPRKPRQLPAQNTLPYLLLTLTALCGEYPIRQISHLPGGSAYLESVVNHTYTIQASKHNDWHEFTVPAEEEQEAPV